MQKTVGACSTSCMPYQYASGAFGHSEMFWSLWYRTDSPRSPECSTLLFQKLPADVLVAAKGVPDGKHICSKARSRVTQVRSGTCLRRAA